MNNISHISDLIGKPYKTGGRGDTGYDCYGLVMEVSKRGGYLFPDWQTLGVPRDASEVIKGLADYAVKIDTLEALCIIEMLVGHTEQYGFIDASKILCLY